MQIANFIDDAKYAPMVQRVGEMATFAGPIRSRCQDRLTVPFKLDAKLLWSGGSNSHIFFLILAPVFFICGWEDLHHDMDGLPCLSCWY